MNVSVPALKTFFLLNEYQAVDRQRSTIRYRIPASVA